VTLNQIHAVVREFLPPSFDRENIACDLWVEAWTRNQKSSTPWSDVMDPPLSREVVRNRCVDEIRKKKIRERHMPDVIDRLDMSPKDLEDWNIVEAAISHLPQPQKLVLFEKFYLGSATRKIAEALSIRPIQVEALLASALETLRAVIREKELS
jgi:RNA polymerase sigma factor (sigma-70 family)